MQEDPRDSGRMPGPAGVLSPSRCIAPSLPGENRRLGGASWQVSTKQEALKVIRDCVGSDAVTYNTTLAELFEEYETDMVNLVDSLESEFGVELYDELLEDVETVGELCQAVVRAIREAESEEVDL